MEQSDLFIGGNLFHLQYPPGSIVYSLGFLVYLPGKILMMKYNNNNSNNNIIKIKIIIIIIIIIIIQAIFDIIFVSID